MVVRRQSAERFAGGILAAANHVAGFCDEVGVIAQIGDSPSHAEFIGEKLRPNVRPTFLTRRDSPTILKQRLVENYFFLKLLEIYEINDAAPTAAEEDEICRVLARELPGYDLVIVIDFGHGMLGDRARRLIREQARFLAVNAQCNAGNLGHHALSKYPGVDYMTATENEIRIEARERHGDIRLLARDVQGTLGCRRLAVTRGRHGCLCSERFAEPIEIPAVAGKVVDRIGAGDAFLSVSALLAVQNAPLEVVGFVGNAAGALAVASVANRDPIDRVALTRQIESLLKN